MSSLTIDQQFKSDEAQFLLRKIEKHVSTLNEKFTYENLVNEVRALNEATFYSTAILRKAIVNLNESTPLVADSPDKIDLAKKKLSSDTWTMQTIAAEEEPIKTEASTSDIDNVINKAGQAPEAGSGGVIGMLKSLWNSLTEGGSAIGILHLVLDFIGLVGDAFAVVGIPIGMVADLINGIIYFWRGKYILGIISLIAMIPFGGDVLKGFKGIAKNFDGPFKTITKSGAGKTIAKESSEVLMKQSGKKFSKSKRFLEYIKKSAAKVVASISNVISFLFKGVLAKAVGWIPFIGKPLKKFFLKIAKVARTIGDNLLGFAKHIDEPVAKAMTAQAEKNFTKMSKAIESGGKVVKEGDHLVVIPLRGKPTKIPIDELSTWSNISKKFPDGPMKSVLKSSDDIADYYVFMSKTSKNTNKWLKRAGDVSVFGTRLTVRDWKLFLAKCIVKVLGSSGNALSDQELDAYSDMVTSQDVNAMMEEHIENEKKRKGSVLEVPYVDKLMRDFPETDLDESEIAQKLQDHLDYNAKRMGLPSFGSYKYAMAKHDKELELEKVYTEDALSPEEFNKLAGINTKHGVSVFESKKPHLKYIKPFII